MFLIEMNYIISPPLFLPQALPSYPPLNCSHLPLYQINSLFFLDYFIYSVYVFFDFI